MAQVLSADNSERRVKILEETPDARNMIECLKGGKVVRGQYSIADVKDAFRQALSFDHCYESVCGTIKRQQVWYGITLRKVKVLDQPTVVRARVSVFL